MSGSRRRITGATNAASGFDRFWAAWPKHDRKKGRSKCAKLWASRKLDAQVEVILTGLEAWKRSEQWAKEDGRFVPGPQPWLNDEAWEAFPRPAGNDSQAGTHRFAELLTFHEPSEEARRLARSAGGPETNDEKRMYARARKSMLKEDPSIASELERQGKAPWQVEDWENLPKDDLWGQLLREEQLAGRSDADA